MDREKEVSTLMEKRDVLEAEAQGLKSDKLSLRHMGELKIVIGGLQGEKVKLDTAEEEVEDEDFKEFMVKRWANYHMLKGWLDGLKGELQ
jgi:hypothetical protein